MAVMLMAALLVGGPEVARGGVRESALNPCAVFDQVIGLFLLTIVRLPSGSLLYSDSACAWTFLTGLRLSFCCTVFQRDILE